MLILLLFICLVVVVGVVAGLAQAGMLPGFGGGGRSSGGGGYGDSRLFDSPGCLLGLIAASVIWFAAWGVVLILSLNFLRSVI